MSHINRELELALQAAFREAAARRHAYLTVEHLLYSLLHDENGARILRNCGVNLDVLRRGLERFFDEELESSEGDEPVQPSQTLAFHRVVQSALQHAETAEKEEVEAGDLLAALFQEPDAHALALLRAQGVSRIDVLRYISHGASKGAEDVTGATPFDDDGDEIADPLTAYASNLTALALDGKLDPMIGRDIEIERTIHVLARRRKNNPIFVGETGVGKTALAEGLALRIHQGQVPDLLKDAEIYSLDMGSLLAGTKYRGDFEARFKALVGAVAERPNAIVFIDEIHSILGAGAAQGATVDASSMLKPLLQSGELRCMGSTTFAEYRRFEKDRALARRFQRIDVPEPSIDDTVKILQGLAPRYEEHHQVHYTVPALRACAELSARHLLDRFLPDKAIDLMDEAGAAVRLRRGKDRRKTVGVRDIEVLIARMAQIPIPSATTSDRDQLENLESKLKRAVFGQDAAIRKVVQATKRSRAGLGGEDRPVGSFLFMGPTGVGKTELAKQLAASLEVPFHRFDMSEYVEKHAIARLIGAPPGYVGYDEGGILVERIRRSPHAVLLLDEIEKAHPDLFDILLQVMDHATLTDNHGREANFRHVTLIMTSNVGAREMTTRSIGFSGGAAGDGSREIERLFSPEFRNRLDEIIKFEQLTPEVMHRVVDKFLDEIRAQLKEKKVSLEISDAALAWLAQRGFDPLFGARPLARLLQTELKDKLANELLLGALTKGGVARIDAGEDELTFQFDGE